MARRKTKKFDYAKDVYYFNIKKGYMNEITIKRMDKTKAIQAYMNYLNTQPKKCEWLGRWDGKKFVEDKFEKFDIKEMDTSLL